MVKFIEIKPEVTTLRDHFAAAALPALISHFRINESNSAQVAEILAENAYIYADAMLKARDVK